MPRPLTDRELDAYRLKSDDLADRAAAALVESGLPRGADTVTALEQSPAGPCQELLADTHRLPPWVDFPRMRPGAHMSRMFSVHGGLSLLLGSLVVSYASQKGVKVLIRSGRLERDVVRRLRDTAEFAMHVASRSGSAPGTAAHRHLIKVRMVHAFIRRAMLRRDDWDPAWGHPINQEDYASTLMMFCHVFVSSMARLGVPVSEIEEDSIHHTFRWVGHVMGVAPELVTESREHERALFAEIYRRHFDPDDDSRTLAHALIQAMAGRPPFYLPAAALYALSRHVVGEELAEALRFPRNRRWERLVPILPRALARAQGAVRRVPGAPVPMDLVGDGLARLMMNHGLG